MTRLLTALCALVVVLVALAPSTAQAARGQTVYFDAGSLVRDGGQREATLNRLESLGVRALRVVVYWRDVAPKPKSRKKPKVDLTDPAVYTWGQYDGLMQDAARRGWPVLLTPSAPAPRWSTSTKKGYVTRPSAKEFQRFTTALGKRYGAQVSTWSVWNEPNHPDFLKPQYGKGKRPLSPGIYRKLVLAMDKGLRASGNGRDKLLFGETAPRGTGKVVAPITFLRGTLCLNARYKRTRKCSKLPADGFANHPYTTKAGLFFVPPGRNDVTFGALKRLQRALDRAGRAGMIKRGLPIYITEFGIQSTPDRYFGVSLGRQVEWRARAERTAWFNPRIRSFAQYLLRDDQPIKGRFGRSRYGGFETGLEFSTGRPKPSFKGFRLTLSAIKKGKRVSLWGLVRPAGGATSADVLYANRGAKKFRKLKTVRTDSRGSFVLKTSLRKGRRYKLRWGAETGAPVRVLSR
jgi:hypothetical protein